MTDENSRYHSILTDVGIDKQAAADAEGIPWKLAKMAVGDGGDIPEPVPDPAQAALLNERYRASLNSLIKDPVNPGTWIAELVIPLDVGGWWVRELGLYDDDDELVAVANCPPSYKPLPSQGSVRTQRVRMRFVISNSGQVELIVSDDIVFATPDYVDQKIQEELNKQDFKHSVLVATTGPIELAGVQAIDDVAVPAGSRVLVKDQVEGKDNGLYLTADDIWVRTGDADSSVEVTPGLLVHVECGTANGNTLWHLITDAPIILGTTALTFQWAGGQNVPTPDVDDRSKKVVNTESVRAQIESLNQQFPDQVYRKNRLINSNFDVWQRGKTGTIGQMPGGPKIGFGPDRWMIYCPADALCVWSQYPLDLDTGINEAKFGLRLSRQGEGQGWNLSQRIENVETLAGRKVTVSFYIRSTVPYSCAVILRQHFGAGSPEPDVDVGTSVEVLTGFKQYAVTLDVGSIATETKGYSGDFLELIINSGGAGSHVTDICSVQVEGGGVSTPYEQRPLHEEYRACLRYFEKSFLLDHPLQSNNGPATCVATFSQSSSPGIVQSALRVDFEVAKRVTPTLALYSPGAETSEVWAQTVGSPCTATNMQSLWLGGFSISCVPPANSNPGYTLQIEWTADAEI